MVRDAVLHTAPHHDAPSFDNHDLASMLLAAPVHESVSLDEARGFLRVEADDEVIVASVAGARFHVEARTRRALIMQSWRITLDARPADGCIQVWQQPLQTLVAARVYDLDNNA